MNRALFPRGTLQARCRRRSGNEVPTTDYLPQPRKPYHCLRTSHMNKHHLSYCHHPPDTLQALSSTSRGLSVMLESITLALCYQPLPRSLSPLRVKTIAPPFKNHRVEPCRSYGCSRPRTGIVAEGEGDENMPLGSFRSTRFAQNVSKNVAQSCD